MAWKLPNDQARSLARQFGLASDGSEDDIFNAAWKLRKYAEDVAKDSIEEAQRDVENGFERFATAARTGRMGGQLGHANLTSLPTRGRYVVFSDHHLTHGGNRQNFMASSGNLELYREVLEQYLDEGFTLVENGDVEDLVIFEPTEAEMERRKEILDEGKGDAASWAALNSRRATKRLAQLREIVEDGDNADYYGLLAEFNRAGRLVRVAGNHDYDLQKGDFLEVLRAKIPDLPAPADYVFLTDEDAATGANVRFAILHGHQFDTTCVPTLAPKLGELFSESLAWAYQGADRTWKWTGGGAPGREWVEEQKGFFDNLVTDDHGEVWGGQAGAAIGAFIGNLHSKDAWEELFGHNIAWEYFEHSDPQKAVEKEVETGEAFFKFRHLDENFLRSCLIGSFPDAATRPKLLLGHTHEVRYKPAWLGDGLTASHPDFDHYLNCGAAGRFENVLWGVEIIDGVEKVVSWSRPALRSGAPERREYDRVDVAVGGNLLVSSQSPIALPALPVEERRRASIWLPAALHVMMRSTAG